MRINSRVPFGWSKIFLSVLFSFAVVSIAALFLGLSAHQLLETRRSEKTYFAFAKLDAAVVSTLLEPALYRDFARATSLSARVHIGKADFEVSLAKPTTLTREYKPCLDYPIGDCGFKIKLQSRQRPASIEVTLTSVFTEAPHSLVHAGRDAILIPKAWVRDPLQPACDPITEFGFMMVGSVEQTECLKKPLKTCAVGTLPKAIAFDLSSKSLEFECGPASKTARCPAQYALSRIDTRTLDSGEAVDGRCVRTTASLAIPALQPRPSQSWSGRVCPTGYRSKSVCDLVNVVSKAGKKCGRAVQAVAGKKIFNENSPVGAVECRVETPTQACGAEWAAQVNLRIECALNEPEFVSAL